MLRHARDGSRVLWRTDGLILDYYANGGLPPSEHLASPSLAGAAPWQPLLIHSAQLADPTERRRPPKRPPSDAAGDAKPPPLPVQLHASFAALLLLSSECSLSQLKADVAQHALTLPLVAHQMLWFGRAAILQRALGVAFTDLRLLRRAFVHPSYAEHPEAIHPSAGRALARTGTLSAQRRTSSTW